MTRRSILKMVLQSHPSLLFFFGILALVTCNAGMANAQGLPNLSPYQPADWSDKIVVSTIAGSTTDSASLKTTDTLFVSWAVANTAPDAQFSPLKSQTKADAAFVRDREVVRSRQVDIDFDLLTSSADLPPNVIAAGRVISLNLFDDANFVAEADRVERTSRGVTWVGRLRGIDLSQVVIIVNGDVVVGNISMPAGRYHIRFVGNGVHEVQEIDQSRFPPDEPSAPIPLQKPDDRSFLRKQDIQADDGSTIDIMVVYSATTRAAAGGTAAMQALIDLAISETNESYQNSGIAQRLRLVHSAEVTYTETGNLSDALNCITDGCIDNVHTLRNTYGADLVSFWVETGGSACGMAWKMATVSSSFSSLGFSTVVRSCATGNYSFGHEMGHNMGARHDIYVDPATTPYAYAHGYIYTAAASPWRTVMAYNDGCEAVGKYCTRIPYWSNPNISYGGVAIGDSTADNRQTLNNTAYTVANFRSRSPVNGVCGSSSGQTLATAPTTNLCSFGTATAVSGSGPWTWSCTGSNGGSTAFCSANKTAGTPSIQVISPNGGETWTTGSTHAITWTSSNLNPSSRIYISYWYNNNWQLIAGPLLPSNTSYSWSIPNTPTTSSYIWIGYDVKIAWEYGDQSDQPFAITREGTCTYTIFPTSALFNSSANTATVTVTTSSSSCSWSATSNASWITIIAGSAGTGNGTVSYSISANTTGSNRTGTMIIGGQTFTVVNTNVSGAGVINLVVPADGAITTATGGSASALKAGYANVQISGAGRTPYGTAVINYAPNGVVWSEVGVPCSPPTTSARIFIEFERDIFTQSANAQTGTISTNTGLAMVNRGLATANISFVLRDYKGAILATGNGTLAPGAHRALFIHQLSQVAPNFNLPPNFSSEIGFATLDTISDQPLSIIALRLTSNQRSETLLTSTPVVDLTKSSLTGPLYFPQIADGGGYRTYITLLNTSAAMETGRLNIYDDNGRALSVTQIGGTTSSSVFTYSIQPGGFYILFTNGSPAAVNAGSVHITPDPGTSTPMGAGIFGFSPGGILVTESGIPVSTLTTNARIYVDKSNGHDTGLAITNPGSADINVTVRAYQPDGVTPAGTSTISLKGFGHTAQFVGQMISSLPLGFTGTLDISSPAPFAALTLRSLVNSRQEFLLTTFPIADLTQAAPSPILFPQIADGAGYKTQIILLSLGGAPTPYGPSGATSVLLSFFGDDGSSINVINSAVEVKK